MRASARRAASSAPSFSSMSTKMISAPWRGKGLHQAGADAGAAAGDHHPLAPQAGIDRLACLIGDGRRHMFHQGHRKSGYGCATNNSEPALSRLGAVTFDLGAALCGGRIAWWGGGFPLDQGKLEQLVPHRRRLAAAAACGSARSAAAPPRAPSRRWAGAPWSAPARPWWPAGYRRSPPRRDRPARPAPGDAPPPWWRRPCRRWRRRWRWASRPSSSFSAASRPER